ncbi:uncharacterized protein PHACADRAFT_212869 [Phanerochaete carnosa HHB-10118-sp]|uniref:ZZ-type domain-containing protein n=1 Tax=Phanerochaete carnosa (strain HHB-10118-sp) TaxID=650164 RepID=K5VI80_PHACS|nr:uncharacterized protein PHACADRAFT_212869 [Phanerochaete carnosa HHB-10118-sp]EKM50968.1 hypothetical protein PHACADRAFT_212869 [Phanerochaete carnosa HHB-10118-sp]
MSTFLGVQAARRRVEHFGVTCDGCRQRIHGVRHKYLHCTDFDFCDKCLSNSVVREQHGFHHQFYPVDSPGDFAEYDRVRSTLSRTPAANVHRTFCDACVANPAVLILVLDISPVLQSPDPTATAISIAAPCLTLTLVHMATCEISPTVVAARVYVHMSNS